MPKTKCCEKCKWIDGNDDGEISCLEPSCQYHGGKKYCSPQPEKDWEERFDEQMKPWVAPFDEAMRFPLFIKEIKSFISQEIAEAERRKEKEGWERYDKLRPEIIAQAQQEAYEEIRRWVDKRKKTSAYLAEKNPYYEAFRRNTFDDMDDLLSFIKENKNEKN